MSNVFQGGSPQSTPEITSGMVLQLANTAIAACNPRAAEILGYTTEQLVGVTTFDLPWQTIYEDGSPFLLEAHPAIVALRSQQPVTDVVMGFYRPDGELVWLKLDSQPLFQANATAPYAVVTTIWDITAQKQQESRVTVERSLLEKEALPHLIELETIYTTAPIGLCFVDPDLRFVRIDQHLADINGLPISEHIGRSLRDVLPQQADELEPLYRQAIASGEPLLNIEFHGVSRSQPQTERDWIVNLHPLKQADGRVLGVNVMVQDVTERKRLERDLRQADRQIATIWDSMTDAYLSLDREWRFTYVNQAAIQLIYQLTNLKPEAFLGKSHWEIFPWSVGQVVEQQYRRAVTEQVPVHFEVLYEPTGNWFEIHAYPAAAGLGVYFRDISDRKQVQIALQQSEERLSLAIDSAGMATWDADMQTGKVIWSKSHFNLLGYEPVASGEATVEMWRSRIHPDDVETVMQALKQAQQTRSLYCPEYRIMRADTGEIRRLKAFGRFIHDERQAVRFIGVLFDDSDRKRAEAALQSSEERLRLALEASRQGMWFWDLESDTLTWTTQCKALFGLAADVEMSYSVFLNALHPDDRQRTHEAVTQAIDNRVNYDIEYRTQWADGTVRWIAAKGRCTYNAVGQPIYMMGVALDIHDRKQTELALQESASRFQTLADNIAQLAWMTDKDGWIFWYNKRWFDYTGTTLEEMQGWGWQKVHHPEHVERVVQRFSHCIATGEFWEDTFPLRGQDGQYRWFLSRAIPIRDEQGEVVRWFGTNTDISDRIQAEQALQERHARLNLLYETTNGLLSAEQPLTFISSLFGKLSPQLDLQYYFNFMVEERDRRQMLHLKSYAGISQAAAAAIEWLEFGQGICGLVAQEHRQILVNNVQQSTLPNAQIIRLLGITAYVSQPLIVQGRLLGTLSFASSTRTSFTSEEIALMQAATDRIAVAIERANLIDSLQQQTEQLIQTNRLKDEFLAVLSHELRSPLNPILGWVKLLQTRKFDETKTAEALATIERNAQLQAQLIEDLLDISRIMRGKIALNAAPVNLAFVISSALDTVQLAAEAKAIQLQVTLASSVLQVFGDATRLQQVVWNLLSNAIEFTPHGGRIEISLTNSQFTIHNSQLDRSRLPTPDSPQYAQIQVTDTGKGIDPEFLPYVFEYFRQEDGSTTRKFGGLGLGLAIAKQIVEMHGGTIGVDSLGEGHGATFTVMLPLLEGSRERFGAGSSEQMGRLGEIHPTPLQGVRILLVDDDADTGEFLSVVLEQKGAIVSNASSAAEALQILEQSSFDILLSDIGMPETDGYELIRTIRSSVSARSIPAIALTAYAQDVDREQAIAAGFQYHVAKPLDTEAVVALIVELVSRGSE